MRKKEDLSVWKAMIISTFVFSFVCLLILIPKPEEIEYEYYTKYVEVNNTNYFEYVDGEIVDYLCDDIVEVNIHNSYDVKAYYVSTIERDPHKTSFDEDIFIRKGYGQCMFKIKRIKDAGAGN